jgi:hypothetical protein
MKKERKKVAPGVLADESTAKHMKINGKKVKYPKERFQWLKKILRGWLFPEYDQICNFIQEITEAKERIIQLEGETTFIEPVILVGSLNHCQVDVRPTVKPEIILSKIDFAAALGISGEKHMVTGCYFTQTPIAIKWEAPKDNG